MEGRDFVVVVIQKISVVCYRLSVIGLCVVLRVRSILTEDKIVHSMWTAVFKSGKMIINQHIIKHKVCTKVRTILIFKGTPDSLGSVLPETEDITRPVAEFFFK